MDGSKQRCETHVAEHGGRVVRDCRMVSMGKRLGNHGEILVDVLSEFGCNGGYQAFGGQACKKRNDGGELLFDIKSNRIFLW